MSAAETSADPTGSSGAGLALQSYSNEANWPGLCDSASVSFWNIPSFPTESSIYEWVCPKLSKIHQSIRLSQHEYHPACKSQYLIGQSSLFTSLYQYFDYSQLFVLPYISQNELINSGFQTTKNGDPGEGLPNKTDFSIPGFPPSTCQKQ